MKCEYCGASMPDPEPAPAYSESYKELREEIGRLEYDNGVLAKDKRFAENGLINCRQSLDHHQSSEKVYIRGKKVWKGVAVFMIATNVLWLIMLVALTGAT